MVLARTSSAEITKDGAVEIGKAAAGAAAVNIVSTAANTAAATAAKNIPPVLRREEKSHLLRREQGTANFFHPPDILARHPVAMR